MFQLLSRPRELFGSVLLGWVAARTLPGTLLAVEPTRYLGSVPRNVPCWYLIY